MSEAVVVEQVIEDVLRVRDFKVESLIQRERLGAELAFDDAIKPARRLCQLFEQLPVEALREFPARQLSTAQKQAKSVYALFDQILTFKASGDPESVKREIINSLSEAYQPAFTDLLPLISYGVARTVDFANLESQGRAAVQAVNDEKNKLAAQIEATLNEAKNLLEEVRNTAAEDGATKNAKFFGSEAASQARAAKYWLIATSISATIVLIYAGLTLFFPVWFTASNTAESIQLVSSKFLIFFVLAYALYYCARNYASCKHNEVTNKHRQNALLTYRTIAEASHSQENRDAILQHAAAAIYSPADSGYLRREERGYQMGGIMQLPGRSLPTGQTPPE